MEKKKKKISIRDHNHWNEKSNYVSKKHASEVIGLQKVNIARNQGGESSCCKDPCTGCCSGGD